jgi:hypothetical protein
MNIRELKLHLQGLIDNGIDAETPIKFRNEKGKHEEIDYSVWSNDKTAILLAEEWFG